MKKSVKMILCIALVLSMLLCFAACGGSDIAGKYTLTSLTSDGTTLDLAAIQQVLGGDLFYVELKADGTGTMNMAGEVVAMSWANGQMWAVGEEDVKIPFTVEDGVLTMEQDGQTLVFEKAE